MRSNEIFIESKKNKDYKINLREQFKGNTVNDIYTVELETHIQARFKGSTEFKHTVSEEYRWE